MEIKQFKMVRKGCRKMNELKCKSCRDESICKRYSDMKFKQEQVNNIPITEEITPITINIECKRFERKALKQDGFNPNYVFRK